MRLLFLCKHYPPAACYGEIQYVAGLSAALASRGHEVHVLSADAGSSRSIVRRGSLTVRPIVQPWPFQHYEADPDTLLKNVQLLGEGLKLSRLADRFDVVCFQGWESCLPGLALSQRLGAPAVCLMHRTAVGAGPPLDEGARYRAEMESWACERAAVIVCPGRTVAGELIACNGANDGKVVVVPPACDPTVIDPGDTNLDDFRALLAKPEDLAVLFAGRMTPDNAPAALLHALPQVLDNTQAIRAVFAGDGPLAGELIQDAERLGVADHCFFLGWAGQCVLAALYRTCDVFIAPALRPPSGIGAVEAMAAGLPVVASDTGALAELVHDGRTGLLIPPGDPDGLAGALLWLQEHRDRLEALQKQAFTDSQDWTWDMAAVRFVAAVESIRRQTVPGSMARVD